MKKYKTLKLHINDPIKCPNCNNNNQEIYNVTHIITEHRCNVYYCTSCKKIFNVIFMEKNKNEL